MKRYTEFSELIAALKAEQEHIQTIIDALQNPKDTTEEKLIIEYLVTRSTVKVAAYAKVHGVKSPAGKAFRPGDMSELINEGSENITPLLLTVARDIFRKNSNAAWRAYG
ncbi:hypothetical protein [Sansalvadorimonas verongulae]|uniref:hypothetical protein n=1 Tax=Sansalvadorimonas verongulae TaxID=2172824 RepID=UPI0012BB7B27|nr:hypothetical protein [Sansalvadorimonas verongulae]MTI11680.1 hypothetical protein [Sansalvadorimonas verongulae]